MTKTTLKAPNNWLNNPVSVWLVGAGGNGGEALDALAQFSTAMVALGGHPLDVTVVDDATVREVNLVRQRFWATDIGQNKAICLANRYNMMLGTRWNAYPCTVQAMMDNVRDYPDLVISAVDLPSVRRWIADQPRLNNSLWLDLGNADRNGQAVMGMVGSDYYPTVEKHYPELADLEDDNTKSCSTAEAIAGQDCLVNRTVATAGMNIVWELLRTGMTDKNGIVIDLKSGMQMPLSFPESDANADAA